MATTHAPMEVDDAAAAVAVFAAQVQRDHPDAEVHLARRKRSGKRVRQHVKDTHEVVAILNGEQVASKRCAPVSHTRSRTCLLPSAPPRSRARRSSSRRTPAASPSAACSIPVPAMDNCNLLTGGPRTCRAEPPLPALHPTSLTRSPFPLPPAPRAAAPAAAPSNRAKDSLGRSGGRIQQGRPSQFCRRRLRRRA